MKFIVELLAFGKQGEIREVNVPDMDHYLPHNAVGLKGTRPLKNSGYFEDLCEKIYHLGQNEVQPQDKPSISAGDVIHIGENSWLVMAAGFHKMTPEGYQKYLSMDKEGRIKFAYWAEISENV